MSEASKAPQGASLESKLADLMQALRANNKDEWEGKPDQSQDNPFAPTTTTADKVEMENSSPPQVQVCRTSGDSSLDDLMKTYLQHVQQVRRIDAEREKATTATTTNPKQSKEDEAENNTETDFNDLLKQLDALPPLERKKDC